MATATVLRRLPSAEGLDQEQPPHDHNDYPTNNGSLIRWVRHAKEINTPQVRGGWRPLHLLCRRALPPGSDDNDRSTAATTESTPTLTDLLAAGANPYLRLHHTGWTALHVACAHGNLPAARRLVQYDTTTATATTTHSPHPASLVHATDRRGWNALHTACFYGQVDVVRYLLTQRHDPVRVNATTHDGSAAVHLVVRAPSPSTSSSFGGTTTPGQRVQVLRLLVHTGGAQINQRNDWNQTALHRALGDDPFYRRAPNHWGLIGALLQCGAVVDREHLVQARQCPTVLYLLLQAAAAQGLLATTTTSDSGSSRCRRRGHPGR